MTILKYYKKFFYHKVTVYIRAAYSNRIYSLTVHDS